MPTLGLSAAKLAAADSASAAALTIKIGFLAAMFFLPGFDWSILFNFHTQRAASGRLRHSRPTRAAPSEDPLLVARRNSFMQWVGAADLPTGNPVLTEA